MTTVKQPSPLLVLGLCAAMMAVCLAAPLALPIGPNYWDLSFYLDAAHRIANGQAPGTDFRSPAGPAEFYLTYLLVKWFPNAHPFLTTQWGVHLIALPLFAVAIGAIDRRDRTAALALAIPFAALALLPINTGEGSTAPGLDGYGVYNRHPALLLYGLVATLIYAPPRWLRCALVAGFMFMLALTKITGFATGVLICAYALVARNIRISDLMIAAFATLAALAVLEMTSGLVSGYAGDLILLASLNTGSFAPRIREVVATDLVLLLALVAIIILEALLYAKGRNPQDQLDNGTLRQPFAWLAALLLFSIGFEAQNTGSQDFVYLWPVLLLILSRRLGGANFSEKAVIVAIALATLPIAGTVTHRALRSVIVLASYQRIDQGELATLGRTLARPADLLTAEGSLSLYQSHRADYQALAQRGVNIADTLTVERTFQIAWLLSIREGARALLDYERNTGRVLETIYTLDFTDPFPFLLGRKPLAQVNLALDPVRTVPGSDPRAARAISSADGILVPQCPVTLSRVRLTQIYALALEGRQRIALSPCWDLYVTKGSDFADARAAR